jgi:hypothetical protein
MTTEKKPKRVSKPKTEEVVQKIEFMPNQLYKMEALKGAKHLIEGQVYEVKGEIAKELYKKGYAKLK